MAKKIDHDDVRFALRLGGAMGAVCGPEMRRDVQAAALLGLVEAAARFDPCRGVNFWTFAYTRIRGAVLDQHRRLGWVPSRRLEAARELLDGESPVVSLGSCDGFAAKPLDPSAGIEARERLEMLDARERRLLIGIYAFDEDSQDAGRAIGVSKSRATRMRQAALAKLGACS